MVMLLRSMGLESIGLPRSQGKGFVPGVLITLALSLIHLLLKFPGLLLVRERQPNETVFKFKGMKECTVLVVREGVKDLLVPYNATAGGLTKMSVNTKFHVSY